MRPTIILCFLIVAYTTSGQEVQFTSAYTVVDFSNCNETLGNGEREGDIPIICKAFEEYQLYVYYNFYGHEIIMVQSSDTASRFSQTLTSELCEDSHQYGAKIEWRLADGKPFACILRVICVYNEPAYDEELKKEYEIFKRYEESLVVVGLEGFEALTKEIDVAKVPKSNESIRIIADDFYKKVTK